jgi:hypothetical protein
MEIVIGAIPSVTRPKDQAAQSMPGSIEAKVLHVRPPRSQSKRTYQGQDKRTNNNNKQDPTGGLVLMLLVPEGYKLPKDLHSGNYRTFLRFVRR